VTGLLQPERRGLAVDRDLGSPLLLFAIEATDHLLWSGLELYSLHGDITVLNLCEEVDEGEKCVVDRIFHQPYLDRSLDEDPVDGLKIDVIFFSSCVRSTTLLLALLGRMFFGVADFVDSKRPLAVANTICIYIGTFGCVSGFQRLAEGTNRRFPQRP
jgi:hypothetical protein